VSNGIYKGFTLDQSKGGAILVANAFATVKRTGFFRNYAGAGGAIALVRHGLWGGLSNTAVLEQMCLGTPVTR
jgi:hypothetical protein